MGYTHVPRVEDEWPALVEGEGAKALSIHSYSSLNDSKYKVVGFNKYRELDLHKVGEHMIGHALINNISWRKKYHIGQDIEIYHRPDIQSNPWLLYKIAFCNGFLKDGMWLPLTPLIIYFFNYTQ